MRREFTEPGKKEVEGGGRNRYPLSVVVAAEGRCVTSFDEEREARAFAIARQLIQEHGDAVGRFLEKKIAALRETGNIEESVAWFIIRNAVALTLHSGDTLQ